MAKAKVPQDKRSVALADANERKAKGEARLQAMYEQFQALRNEGAELEKQLYAIEGEIKALKGLA